MLLLLLLTTITITTASTITTTTTATTTITTTAATSLPIPYDCCRCIVRYCFEERTTFTLYIQTLVFIDNKFKNIWSSNTNHSFFKNKFWSQPG